MTRCDVGGQKNHAAKLTSTQNKYMCCWWAKYSCSQINIYSKQVDVMLADQKKGGNIFQCMKLEELMAGEDSKLAGRCYKLAGTNFTIGEIKFL